jgi:prepilin-type N-terminal cleavage/methylation domain-containing protein
MPRAFTLMELMVAMAMAAAIGTAAVMAGVQMQRTMTATRKHVVVWDEAKRVEEALLTLLQEAGGSPLTPATAIDIEQNTCAAIVGEVTIPACNGQDRVRITNVQATYQQTTGVLAPLPVCRVTGANGVVLDIATDAAGCSCLFPENPTGKGNVDDERSPWERRQGLLVRDNGDVVELNLHETKAGCRVNAPGASPGDLGAGKLVAITRRIVFTVPDPNQAGALQIQTWLDQRQGLVAPDSIPQANEVELFADNVYGFQLAEGFDGGGDGTVVDANSTTDDWVGNVPNDTQPAAISDDGLLRMIGVAVIVGRRSDQFAGETRRIYNGDPVTVPGVYLVEAQSKVALRNLNISVP